jgi:hypothetical protein
MLAADWPSARQLLGREGGNEQLRRMQSPEKKNFKNRPENKAAKNR